LFVAAYRQPELSSFELTSFEAGWPAAYMWQPHCTLSLFPF